MHKWGDEGVDWEGLGDCAHYLGVYCRRWGRFGGQTKEKYGTVRFYAHIGHLSLHNLFHPGYMVRHRHFPKCLWELDIRYISPLLISLFGRAFLKWNKIIYNQAYQNALKKWPHLKAEILCGADYPELIKGAAWESV